MRKYTYPCATGIAIAGAGVALAFGAGAAQAAPALAPPLSPASSAQSTTGLACLMVGSGCSAVSGIQANAVVLSPTSPTPNMLAAAVFSPGA
jgi:hypothetical protein